MPSRLTNEKGITQTNDAVEGRTQLVTHATHEVLLLLH